MKIRPHHLLCAVCQFAGCQNVPAGDDYIADLRKTIKSDPWTTLTLVADLDIISNHYNKIFCQDGLADDFEFAARMNDYTARLKDLEILKTLGIRPETTMTATEAVRYIFRNIESLKDICYYTGYKSRQWVECPHARADHYAQIRAKNADMYFSLEKCFYMGEELEGSGVFSLLPTRTKEEMMQAKKESAERVMNAERLFIRPHHLLCLLCHYGGGHLTQPLDVDNLYEVLKRLKETPNTPVTLVEGCCMVCDPCPAYNPEKHVCMWMFVKDQLKDLRVFQKLGLAPGDTISANTLIDLIFSKIKDLKKICGSRAMNDNCFMWASCPSSKTDSFNKAKENW